MVKTSISFLNYISEENLIKLVILIDLIHVCQHLLKNVWLYINGQCISKGWMIHTHKSQRPVKKMKALNSLFMVLVFVVFALSINIDICFGASKFIHPLRPMKVTIMNSQTTDTLLAHCKSKNMI